MSYIDWHYFEIWPRLITYWRNISLFPFYFFSVPLHLKTLFSPWRRQLTHKKPGFHFDDVLGVIFFNLTSRVIGILLRLSLILYGLIFTFILFFLAAVPVILWVLLPVFTFPLYLISLKTKRFSHNDVIAKSNNNLKALASVLFKQPQGKFIIDRLGLSHQLFNFDKETDPGDWTAFTNYLKKKINDNPEFSDLFEALVSVYQPLITIFSRYNFSVADVYQTALWYERLSKIRKTSAPDDLNKIKNIPGIGASWAYGYTVEFDKYGRDLTKHPTPYPLLLGREEELTKMQQILLKGEGNNILLVGEPGTARHILVYTLASAVATGNCLPGLSHKRLIELDMHALTATKPTFSEVKGLAVEILSEAERAGNIIIVIDEIDKFVSEAGERVDYTSVFSQIASSHVGLIGITTNDNYHRYIESNADLSKLFEKIDIKPPDIDTVLEELEVSIVPVVERKHKIFVTFGALVKIIEDSDRYITNTPFPAKAIDLLDEVAVYLTSERKETVLRAFHIDEFLTSKLHFPIGDLQKSEKDKLIGLEELLHKRIINQDEAIRVLAAALRRARLNIAKVNKPMGSFLFLGPTGVGKTETAKALAQYFFGGEQFLIRFDMSQYQKEEGLERLIGSAKMGTPGELSKSLRDHPYAVLLFDEFEKADPLIYNLFLTLIDEGYITDHTGKRLDGRNTIIIATSNAGASFIRENLKLGVQGSNLAPKILDYVQKERIFSPELVNRFDGAVVFTPLSEGHLREVAKLMLGNLNSRLAKNKISVKVTEDLVKKLAILGFAPEFGARAINRVIAEKIEDAVAQKLLSGTVAPGEQIRIDL